MRILALESATLTGGAALLDGDRLVGESVLSVSLTHSERLMAMADRLLRDCDWTAKDLEGLAVSIGPGSFTGIRVGVATMKGPALALGLPVAPVPTLDALASTLPFADVPVCPLLYARKGEVYVSLYRWQEDRMMREWAYLALPPGGGGAGAGARAQTCPPLSLAPMTLDDLDDVLAIERVSFKTPWSRAAFRYELTQNRVARCMVARAGGGLCGSLCLWEIGHEIHITNLAVNPEWRRRGTARALLESTLAEGRDRGGAPALLEVRPAPA